MSKRLLIVTGYPGSGKSYLSSRILAAFPRLQLMSYDTLKEEWFDREGFDSMEGKARLTDRCLRAFWRQLDSGMASGGDWLIEYPFCRKHVPMLARLIAAHGYSPVTVVLTGETAVLWRRFVQRDANAARHPGHRCSVYHKDGAQVPAARLSLEEYALDCANKDYFINLGPSINLDMTDVSKVDLDGLMSFLHTKLNDDSKSKEPNKP